MKNCENCGAVRTGESECPYCGTVFETEQPQINNVQTSVKEENKSALPVFVAGILTLIILITASAIIVGILQDRSKDSGGQTFSAMLSGESVKSKDYMRDKGIYTGDIFSVGDDIPAGEYLVISDGKAGDSFYCGVYSDKSASDSSKIYGDWNQNCTYVVLEEGQYIKASWAVIYDLLKNDIRLDPFSNGGMYKTGRDIEAGTYTIVSDDSGNSGSYSVYYSINSVAPAAKSSGHISSADDEKTITLSDGEYIKMRYCHLKREE